MLLFHLKTLFWTLFTVSFKWKEDMIQSWANSVVRTEWYLDSDFLCLRIILVFSWKWPNTNIIYFLRGKFPVFLGTNLAANPEKEVWWGQMCWKMICFRAEAWMCHNHCGRKYSGFRAYATKLLKLMPCDYTGNSVPGVVWSVATPSGNSFTF